MSNRERVSTCVLMLRNDKSTFWNYLSIQVFLQFFFVFFFFFFFITLKPRVEWCKSVWA